MEDDLITRLWSEVTGGRYGGPPSRPELVVTGPTGLLPSPFAVEEVALACVAVALLAAGAVGGRHPKTPPPLIGGSDWARLTTALMRAESSR